MLYRLSAQLGRLTDLQDAFAAFGAAVRAQLPWDRIGVVVPEGKSLVMALSVARPPLPSHQGAVWLRTKKSVVESVLDTRTPRIVGDLAREHHYADEVLLHREGIQARFLMPLVVGGDMVGVFFVDSRKAHVYTERHLQLLAPVAEPLALALQNARLYAEVTRRAREVTRQLEERTKALEEANKRLEAAAYHKWLFRKSSG